MAYVPPTIDATGLVLPTYEDIRDALLQDFLTAYPASSYTGIDTADYQWISAIALKQYDTLLLLQIVYNGRSPATAIGADLDALVKLNGIARKPASYGTVTLTLVGTPGAVLNACQAQDQNGFLWDLPAVVQFPQSGTINVQAVCDTSGDVQAAPNTITIKATVTAGWVSVTNPTAAVPGQPVETDSQLRARQAISVALPSRTMLAGTIAAIAAVPGVTRYYVEENPTGAVDANGCPPHSISAVVEGGTDLAVAQAIYNKRGIGALTNGSTPPGNGVTVDITDPQNGDFVIPIGFYRPTYVPAFVAVQVHPLSATAYTSAVASAIKTAIVGYLNSLQIGETLTLSALYAVAMQATPDIKVPVFSIRSLQIGTAANALGTNDIGVAFNQVISGDPANVTVSQV